MIPQQPSDTTDSRAWEQRERVLEAFEAAWERGERPRVEVFLPADFAGSSLLLHDLVQVEFEWRLKSGEAIRVRDYLQRHPRLADDRTRVLELMAIEFAWRSRQEPALGLQSYLDEFPEYAADLAPLLQANREAAVQSHAQKTDGNVHPGLNARDTEAVDSCLLGTGVYQAGPAPDEAGLETQVRAPGGARGRPPAPDSALHERYASTRLFATGGLGRVWLGRDQSLGRDVAVKDLRPEVLGDASLRARFLEEAKITGQLEHPGVVPVYELAESTGQSPFYAMRFVRGRTLGDAVRDYHRQRKAGTADALQLRTLLNAFVAVCNTLAYAHSRGVIHRDLKGLNVILGDFGEVIVLDWGLAKVLGAPGEPVASAAGAQPVSLTADTGRDETMAGQILGTPAYMAPEQAAGLAELINTSTDVYGLGAILYEILTGQPPFTSSNTLLLLKQVREEKPARPRQISWGIPRPLEAICLKALAKDQGQRYPSAAALADDVQRWLADEPVSVWREPLLFRLARWARRHKTFVTGAAALVVTALVAVSVGYWLLSRENAKTEIQKLRAEKINEFLVDGLLLEAAPQRNARAKQVTVEEVLRKAPGKIERYLRDQPEVEASVRNTLGVTYLRLGLYDDAEQHLRRALELHRQFPHNELERLLALNNLGRTLHDRGRLQAAEAPLRECLDGCNHAYGLEHGQTRAAMVNLAGLLIGQDKLDQADELLARTLAILDARLPLAPERFAVMNNFGAVQIMRGRLDKADAILGQALKAQRGLLQPEDVGTLALLRTLGLLRQAQGRKAEAQELLQKSLEGRRKVLGTDHPETLKTQHDLAVVLAEQNRFKEAEGLLREIVTAVRERQLLPADHPDFGRSLVSLAATLVDQGRAQEAEPLAREGLEISSKALPPEHWQPAEAKSVLGGCLTALAQYASAEELLRGAHQALQASQGGGPSRLESARKRLVRLYEAWGNPQQAAEWRKAAPVSK